MKALKITSVAMVALGILMLSSEIWRPVSDSVSLGVGGYIGSVLGCITLLLSRARSKEGGIATLFFAGLALCFFADRLPWFLFSLAFGDDSRIGSAIHARDSAFIFLPLGLACILTSWILIVTLKPQKKNEA
jgi:hypothetical protein